MKKIANTSRWGKIAMLLNAVLLILIVVTVVQLKKYDGLNMELQKVKPVYTAVQDSIKRLERTVYVTEKKITDNIKVKNDLQTEINEVNRQISSMDKKRSDSLKMLLQDRKGQVEKQVNITREDSAYLGHVKDTLCSYQKAFLPVDKEYNNKMQKVVPALKSFNTIVAITIVLFIIKVFFLAYWMACNMQNIRLLCPWLKPGRSSNEGFEQPSASALKSRAIIEKIRYSKAWSVIGWFIPVYNLFKPCSMFNELLDETNGLLKDKSILADTKDSNQMESVGFWWGSYLFAKVLMPLVVGGIVVCFNFWFLFGLIGTHVSALDMGVLGMGTFFGVKGLFCYLSHKVVLLLFLLGWLVYLGYECYMIFSYNKLNRLLVDNESKFDIPEEEK